MLILSRKQQEAIHIGDNISVVVGRIRGNSVSLAIDAPINVKIVRSELRQASVCPENLVQGSNRTVKLPR